MTFDTFLFFFVFIALFISLVCLFVWKDFCVTNFCNVARYVQKIKLMQFFTFYLTFDIIYLLQFFFRLSFVFSSTTYFLAITTIIILIVFLFFFVEKKKICSQTINSQILHFRGFVFISFFHSCLWFVY